MPANYLLLAAANGVVWLVFLAALFGHAAATPTLAVAANLALAFAAAAKWRYWRALRSSPAASTMGSATGLGRPGSGTRVHALDPPHTEPNWLQREMGYQVARRHAERLRTLVWLLAFLVPSGLCVVGWFGDAPGRAVVAIALGLAAVSASAGILVERWLFFAEAEHKMTLYYGKDGV